MIECSYSIPRGIKSEGNNNMRREREYRGINKVGRLLSLGLGVVWC
jgi:hypothetical protein